MDNFYTRSKRSSHLWTRRGFSLPELIVTLTVMGIIMGLAVPMVVGVRDVVRVDQVRTSANQRVREATDLIAGDIRIAGERFPVGNATILLPVEVVDGDGGTPDEIILRRSLWGGTLPICETTLQGANQTIRVVRDNGWLNSPEGQAYPECGQPVDEDGWPRNLAEIRDLAEEIGEDGVLSGYIFDPANEVGEFISFEVQDNADNTGQIHRITTTNLENSYELEDRPRIYVMSERRYRVREDILELVPDGDEDEALRATADIVDLQATYVLEDETTETTLPDGVVWRDIAGIEINVTSRVSSGGEEDEQTLTSRYFPRNILSR